MANNLIELTRRNDIEGVKKFISEGEDINLQDEDGWTALMMATFYYRPEIAKLLVEGGADLDIQNKWGYTALMIASNFNYFEIAKALVEGGAKKDLLNKYWLTALEIAKKHDHEEIIELLIPDFAELVKQYDIKNFITKIKKRIDAGIDVNFQNQKGNTALMTASWYCRYEIVKLLIESGAKKDLQDKFGRTALDYAIAGKKSNDYQEIIELLTTNK